MRLSARARGFESLTLRHKVRQSMIQWATVLFYFSAEEVLVGKLQKVLELLNRIIFSAASEIRAYYIMYLQDWGEKLKIIFQNCSPMLIDCWGAF